MSKNRENKIILVEYHHFFFFFFFGYTINGFEGSDLSGNAD